MRHEEPASTLILRVRWSCRTSAAAAGSRRDGAYASRACERDSDGGARSQGAACAKKQDAAVDMDSKPEKKEGERKDFRKRNSLFFSVVDFVKTQHDTEEARARDAMGGVERTTLTHRVPAPRS